MAESPFPAVGQELRSTVTDADALATLAVHQYDIAEPGPDEVVIKVEAAPINPSDMGMLFAGGDVGQARSAGAGELPAVAVPLSKAALGAQRARWGAAMHAGNEGGGIVVAAGSSAAAQALLGRVVGFLSGNAYGTYRTIHHASCLAMNDGTTPEQAAACFVNPLTALGMVETMAAEGHTALVHTVGASNLGQMLTRICIDDGIGLVNIVRKQEHVEMLVAAGAQHVVDSSAESFRSDLVAALNETGATIAFDAIGGGEMAGTLLSCMEQVASQGAEFSRYGSDSAKQVYIYGGLDRGPTMINRDFGLTWSISGWLLTPFLGKIGGDGVERLRRRVADEVNTTFASTYGMRLTLAEAVDPENVKRYGRISTGDKALVTPNG